MIYVPQILCPNFDMSIDGYGLGISFGNQSKLTTELCCQFALIPKRNSRLSEVTPKAMLEKVNRLGKYDDEIKLFKH